MVICTSLPFRIAPPRSLPSSPHLSSDRALRARCTRPLSNHSSAILDHERPASSVGSLDSRHSARIFSLGEARLSQLSPVHEMINSMMVLALWTRSSCATARLSTDGLDRLDVVQLSRTKLTGRAETGSAFEARSRILLWTSWCWNTDRYWNTDRS